MKFNGEKLFLGITLIILGILLLLENFDVNLCLYYKTLFKLWPLFFVYRGIKKILADRKPQKDIPTPSST